MWLDAHKYIYLIQSWCGQAQQGLPKVVLNIETAIYQAELSYGAGSWCRIFHWCLISREVGKFPPIVEGICKILVKLGGGGV